jgi:menaquinone-dependent protoporphyrinogen IX oxidase
MNEDTMMNKIVKIGKVICLVLVFFFQMTGAEALAGLKGVIIYDSRYGSTAEVAYWIRAIVGEDQHLEVKYLDQIVDISPYDYVIFGSYTRWEKPSPRIYKFVEKYQDILATKKVGYFLLCGDCDETMILKTPGGTPHLIAGRNYLYDIQHKFPRVKPVILGGFGGRQVNPTLNTFDKAFTAILERLAREGVNWAGRDVWESLIPERVEYFANEIRVKILGIPPIANPKSYRKYWDSLQPAKMGNPAVAKLTIKPYVELRDTDRVYFNRFRVKDTFANVEANLKIWAKDANVNLAEQRKTDFCQYYHGKKNYGGTEVVLHIVLATMPEDPNYMHISVRNYDKKEKRGTMYADIAALEKQIGFVRGK